MHSQPHIKFIVGYVAYVSVKLVSHFQVSARVGLIIGLFYKQAVPQA